MSIPNESDRSRSGCSGLRGRPWKGGVEAKTSELTGTGIRITQEGAKNAHLGASFLIVTSGMWGGWYPGMCIFTQHPKGL